MLCHVLGLDWLIPKLSCKSVFHVQNVVSRSKTPIRISNFIDNAQKFYDSCANNYMLLCAFIQRNPTWLISWTYSQAKIARHSILQYNSIFFWTVFKVSAIILPMFLCWLFPNFSSGLIHVKNGRQSANFLNINPTKKCTALDTLAGVMLPRTTSNVLFCYTDFSAK